MILSNRQSARFVKLFAPLATYLIAEYCKTDGAVQSFESEEEAVDIVCDYVWGEEGHLDLIDRYLKESPTRINGTDRRAILAFKEGIYSAFPTAHIGADTFFLAGNYALAVRGIDSEIPDIVGSLPCLSRTLLVPFDGLITYGEVISVPDEPDLERMSEGLESLVRDQVEAGNICRTERQFRRIAPAIKEEIARSVQEFESGEGSHGIECHVGALAGLSWDERKKAVTEHLQAERESDKSKNNAAKVADGVCEKGSPAGSVKEYVNRLARRELVDLAEAHDLGASISKKSRAQLAQLLTEHYLENARDAIEGAIMWGAEDTTYARDLVLQGGTIRITREQFQETYLLPTPRPPYVCVYHDGEDYLVVMPPEICERIKDYDFEDAIRRAEEVDRTCSYIASFINFRGIATMEEISDLLYGGPEANPISTVEAFRNAATRLLAEKVGIEMADLDETGNSVLVHELLAREARVGKDGKIRNPQAIFDLLDEREGKPERPIEQGLRMSRYMEEKESYRRFVTFLDSHVPDGKDDYEYATSIADYLHYYALGTKRLSNLIADVLSLSPDLEEDAQKEYLQLIKDLINDTPQWANYGWSANELNEIWGDREIRRISLESAEIPERG